MTNLERIHKYLKSKGIDEETLNKYDSSTIYLSMEIMEYAHRNVKRVNGDDYITHPMNILGSYRKVTLINECEEYQIDEPLMKKLRIPYIGVQEVCLLHDVIEDTELTMSDLEEIFNECNFGSFFSDWIKYPLGLITHDKSEGYDTYITKLKKNPTSALVKLLDLLDNSNFTTLDKFGNYEYDRCKKYLRYAKRINDNYHFIENLSYYRRHRNITNKIDY